MFRYVWRKIKNFFSWYPRLYKGRKWYTKICIAIVSSFFFLIVYLGMVDINFLWLFGESPGFSDIMDPPTTEASELYSDDGKLIGKFYNENRSPVRYEDISPVFWKALIDTEDERYFSHHGIDFRGFLGAIKDAILRHPRGASTITQQLAKNMFHVRTKHSTGLLGKIPGLGLLIQKSKEWILASKLELVYNKQEILAMYANTVEFGANSYGIKTACRTYFNTTPDKLNTQQAATLVGMLKAITFYNPLLHPERCIERRNIVLNNMMKQGDLTYAEYDVLRQTPLGINYTPESDIEGQAAYFRRAIADYLSEWCQEYGYDLYNSGLKIYTTLDTRMQKYAEQAVHTQMQSLQESFNGEWGSAEPWRDEKGNVIPHFINNIAKRLPVYRYLSEKYPGQPDSVRYYLNKPHRVKLWSHAKGHFDGVMSTLDSIRYMVKYLHSGFIAMEPQTGAVKAWVGDIDFKTWNYDKVRAHRQPGSTFKLFVYTEAMNQGLTPCDKRRDEPINVPVLYKGKNGQQVVEWKPDNAGGRFSGDSISLKMAFAKSLNSIAVRLIQEMGVRHVIRTAHDMGITSELTEHPSISLGSSDVSLYEMVSAYSTIANGGRHHKPILVTRILDRDGREIYSADEEAPRALPFKTAYFMQQLLMTGVKAGTSRSMSIYMSGVNDTDIGGKTGTTNNNSDAWFIAVTPKLVAGAWVGGEYRSIHFKSGALGQGARAALPICGRFLSSVFKDKKYQKYHSRFEIPKGEEVSRDWVDCTSDFSRHQEYGIDSLGVDSTYYDNEYDDFGYPIEGNYTNEDYYGNDFYGDDRNYNNDPGYSIEQIPDKNSNKEQPIRTNPEAHIHYTF